MQVFNKIETWLHRKFGAAIIAYNMRGYFLPRRTHEWERTHSLFYPRIPKPDLGSFGARLSASLRSKKALDISFWSSTKEPFPFFSLVIRFVRCLGRKDLPGLRRLHGGPVLLSPFLSAFSLSFFPSLSSLLLFSCAPVKGSSRGPSFRGRRQEKERKRERKRERESE